MTQIELAKKVEEMRTLARDLEQVYLVEKNQLMMHREDYDARYIERFMMIESSYNAMKLIGQQLAFNVHCVLLKDGE